MTTLTRPAWLVPSQCTLALRKSGLQFVSPFNGTMQSIETLAERWVMSINLPIALDGGARSAFLNQWAGGVNLVALYHFGRPQPLGTLRGAPTLAVATARGNSSLQLAGCRTATNLLIGGGFGVAAGSTGRGVGWSAYSAGSVAGLAYTRVGGPWSWAQLVSASSLGGSGSDQAGIALATMIDVSAGQTYTVAADIFSFNASHQIAAGFYTSGGTYLGGGTSAAYAAEGGYVRRSHTVTAPATAEKLMVWIYMLQGTGASPELRVDQVTVSPGSEPQPYTQATLATGDMIGDGAQLYQVGADCTAADDGTMTVPIVNRCRGAVAQGTTVLWDRPTALFCLPAMEQPTTWQRGGHIDSQMLDAVEVY